MPKHARTDWRTTKTPQLRGFARTMRHQPTEAEARLWSLLRNRRLVQFKFRRQLPVGSYIVDFVCLSAKLIVEADGSQHVESQRDTTRDLELNRSGFRILRLWNDDILARSDDVLNAVWHALHPNPPPIPPSPLAGEGARRADEGSLSDHQREHP